MRKVGRKWFFVVLALIVGLGYLTIFGLHTSEGDKLIRSVSDIAWGIDVSGGISVTFGPSGTEAEELTAEQTNSVAETLRRRLEDSGISDSRIYSDTENLRIIVTVPCAEGESQRMEELVDTLSATARIQLVEGRLDGARIVKTHSDSRQRIMAVDSRGTAHRQTLDSSVITGVRRTTDESGNIAFRLTFDDDGTRMMLESTGRLTAYLDGSSERYITVCIDGVPISSLYVEGATDECVISSPEGFTEKEAAELESYINNGALDYSLQIMDFELIDPSLGQGSVRVMIIAGVIAFAIICLFMVLRYRLPGVVACIALFGQVAGILAAVSGFFPFFDGLTLTLPGVAGIILSIGMGVDANIITGERISEEIRKGKSIDGAIDAGNENSFSSIFDGNVTVIIVSVILMGLFGPPGTVWNFILKPFNWMFPASAAGSVYSFGCTLFVGVIFNFIMGVTASRVMLRSLSGFSALRSRRLYGGVE